MNVLLRFSPFVLVLLASALASSSSLPDSTGTLEGEVRGINQPVGDALVVLPGTRLGAHTDPGGHFRITEISPATYRLRILSMGRSPFDTTIHVTPGANPPYVFHLGGIRGFREPMFYSSSADGDLIESKDGWILGDSVRTASRGGSFRVTTFAERPSQVTMNYWLRSEVEGLTIVVSDSTRTSIKTYKRKRGSGKVVWDGKDKRGSAVPTGEYLIRFIADLDTVAVKVFRGAPPHGIPIKKLLEAESARNARHD